MGRKRLLEKGEKKSFLGVRQQKEESQVHIEQTSHEREILD
jgi:hypothetical protein